MSIGGQTERRRRQNVEQPADLIWEHGSTPAAIPVEVVDQATEHHLALDDMEPRR